MASIEEILGRLNTAGQKLTEGMQLLGADPATTHRGP